MNRPRKKWEDCKVFLMCTLLVLLLPFGFLFFFIPGKRVPVFFHPRQNSQCTPNAAVPEEARNNSLATAGFQ